MTNPYLIGLTGKLGSGKNTVGDFIKEWAQENGQKAQLQGFADSLKLSFARIFVPDATLDQALRFADSMKKNGALYFSTPLMDHDLFDKFGPNRSITGRQALQHYGTEAHRRVFADNFWVDQLLPEGRNQYDNDAAWFYKWDTGINYAVVTDLRFPNEAQRINDLDGMVFRIVRPELDSQSDSHASEKPLDDDYIFDTIVNDSSLNDLRETVWKLMDYNFGAGNVELKEYGFAPGGSELAIGVGA